MQSRWSAVRAGIRAQIPLTIGTIPFGIIWGALGVAAGLPPAVVVAMSVLVYAGASQFAAAGLITAGAPALVTVLTTLVINLRHVWYSASLAPHLADLSARWKFLFAFTMSDPAYATAIQRYSTAVEREKHHQYVYLGGTLLVYLTWQTTTVTGMLLGARIPPAWNLDFALPLSFIALLAAQLRDRALGVAALTAALTALLLAGLPYQLGMVIGSSAGVLAGWGFERLQRGRAAEAAA
jgi:4-azaleucine resistance transporter AzlC